MNEKKMLEAGKIVNTHGIRGEVKIQPWCDSVDFLLEFKQFYISDASVNVLSSRIHKNMLLATLENVSDIDQAQKLKGKVIMVDVTDLNLPEGRYFVQDLIGLRVELEDGSFFGTIFDVLSLPSHDIYHVKSEHGEHMIPVVPEFIKNIDIENEIVTVHLIEGM